MLKHPEISSDSDRTSSSNPCPPLELCETMTGIWEAALPGVVLRERDRVQIIITSSADRKSFPSSGSSRIRPGQRVLLFIFFRATADVCGSRDILRKS